MKIKELLTKKPFYRLTNGSDKAAKYNKPMQVDKMVYAERPLFGQCMAQADYLEEFYPFSHRVMSEFYFPEFYNFSTEKDEKGVDVIKYHREETFRIGSTLQCLTTVQHLVHMTGNDLHFELTDAKVDSEIEAEFRDMQKGWLSRNGEVALYNLVKSTDMTADAAVVFYMQEGKLGIRSLSYLDGDTLYPHYDPISGKEKMFARKFYDYDEDGNMIVCWVEVWDDEFLTRYKQSLTGVKGKVNRVMEIFGLEGFEIVYRKRHGFSRCPVVYFRDKNNGPVWNIVQALIDDYEVALSYLAKNSAGTALPAYKLKGDNVDVEGDPLGRIRAFTMDREDDVELLQPKGLSENYIKYIELLLNEIFQGAFIVKQPELKSGDTPTGTMKLYYAPSLDKATNDAKEFKPAIDEMVSLFCEGWGMEHGKMTEYMRLSERIFAWIIPFVHEDTASTIANLVSATGAGILSKESATEHNPYATNNEVDRITKETKQEQQADRLFQLTSRQTSAT